MRAMFRTLAAAAIGLFVTVSLTFAQAQPTNTTPPAPAPVGILGRPSPPQPLQRQGVEYFVGTWAFKWTGRESALTAGPRTATVTFTRMGETPSLQMRTEGTVDGGGAYTETATLEWREAAKILEMRERIAVGNGVEHLCVGDWTSAIAVRFECTPEKSKGLRLKRVFSIISATSFTVAEELSTDGGPYVRLGSGTYTKQK